MEVRKKKCKKMTFVVKKSIFSTKKTSRSPSGFLQVAQYFLLTLRNDFGHGLLVIKYGNSALGRGIDVRDDTAERRLHIIGERISVVLLR